ncbi:MAG: hypothetical protein Q8O30_12375 [Candidatus Omnitrophota bacterium]|nr:hypothetical protein [Candidatus Omnitrophota bacterium]
MHNRVKDIEKDIKHRVITSLDRKELDFLDKLGKDALFSTGHKLSYNDILRSLIDFVMEIGLSADKVDSEKAFKEKILRQVKNIQKGINFENKNNDFKPKEV